MKKIEKIVSFLENTSLSWKNLSGSFLAIVGVRLFIESLLFGLQNKDLGSFLSSFLQTLLFFWLAYLILLFYLRIIVREKYVSLASLLLWGQWIIIFPPIVDKLIFQDREFYSFYIFDSLSGLIYRFFTLFGADPGFGITYGTRIEVVLVSLVLGFYIYLKRKNIFTAVSGLLGVYGILFFLGCFPSFLAFLLKFSFQVSAQEMAALFFQPLSLGSWKITNFAQALNARLSLVYVLLIFVLLAAWQWQVDRQKFLALLKNIRYPQMVFNVGLFLIGLGLGWFYYPESLSLDIFFLVAIFNVFLLIFSAWFFSVFVNDLVDERIDRITNQDRPLVQGVFSRQEYGDYSLVFLWLSLVSALVISPKFFLLTVVYHLLTWVYSAFPFRLKRFVGVASALSSLASLIFLVLGFIMFSADQSLAGFPWKIGGMLFVGYFLAIPLKDLKDLQGDKADGVYTLPVLLGEEKARLVLASLILMAYFWSVYVFNERLLFFPALFCGALSFWIITNKKIQPRQINWQVLLTGIIYVIILVAIIFG